MSGRPTFLRGQRGPRAGFTLIELLVAISILAIVAVLGWRGLDGIIRSRAVLTAQMEQTRGMQLAFAQLQSDCENLAASMLVHGRAYLQAGNGRITLVRMVLAENEATRLQVVSYRVADGVLTRRETASTRDLLQLDALWQAALGDTDGAAGVALQAGVNGMTVRFWMPDSANAGNAGAGWRAATGVSTASAAAPLAANLPTGMEVSLALDSQAIPMIKSFLLGAL